MLNVVAGQQRWAAQYLQYSEPFLLVETSGIRKPLTKPNQVHTSSHGWPGTTPVLTLWG